MNLFQKFLAHGMAGCLTAVCGAVVLGALAYSTMGFWDFPPPNAPDSEWMTHGVHWLFTTALKLVHVGVGVLIGLLLGFFFGAALNVFLVRHSIRTSKSGTARQDVDKHA